MFQSLSKSLSRLSASVRRESEQWRILCDACGREKSLAEAGGFRWGGFGKTRTVGFCTGCGKLEGMTIHHPTHGPL